MLGIWVKNFKLKQQYSTGGRSPFFALAGEYLPASREAIVLDIAAGNCEFAEQLRLTERYPNFYPLDANIETVKVLTSRYQAILYRAPERLPFNNQTVDYIHISHLIEHLVPEALYQFLQELDRVLSPGGRLVISTPLLWDRFYDDLSHVRPYNPQVLVNYLCRSTANRSAGQISNHFKVLNLTYRYRCLSIGEHWGSHYLVVDVAISFIRTVLSSLKFCHFLKNGYTIVLEKQA